LPAHLDDYLTSLGSPTPRHSNPSDHAIQLVNTEFYTPELGGRSAQEHLDHLASIWREHSARNSLAAGTTYDGAVGDFRPRSTVAAFSEGVRKTVILSNRNMRNYTRNLLAYGIRRESFFALSCFKTRAS
jgi:hypothetical protein